jgi:hypothetical protein
MSEAQLNIEHGLETAHYLWPEFTELGDFVFFTWCAPESIDMNAWHDRVEVESTLNHTHILDLFDHGSGLDEEPFWDSTHPDFTAACEYGKIWVQSIASKLSRDYPTKNFRVYCTQYDDPIVRFHQVFKNEPNLLDVEKYAVEIANEEIVVLDVNAF